MKTAAESEIQPVEIDPTGARVVVRLVNVETRESLLHLDTVEKPTEYGILVGVGPDVKDPRMQPGALVVFGKFSGYLLEGESEDTMVLREEDVIGFVSGGRVVPQKKQRQDEIVVPTRAPIEVVNPAFRVGR